jgi:hypothetical protein
MENEVETKVETKKKVSKQKSLNIIVEMVIVLFITNHVISIFSNIIKLLTEDLTVPLYNICSSIFMIVSLVLIMSKNKLGIILFYSLQVLNIIGLSILGTNDIMTNITVTLSICVVFTGLLFIRSNGVSAWSLILKGKNAKSN